MSRSKEELGELEPGSDRQSGGSFARLKNQPRAAGEKNPGIDQENEKPSDRIRRLGASIIMLKREAVWQLALAKGVMKPWLVRYLYPSEVLDVEKRVQEQGA